MSYPLQQRPSEALFHARAVLRAGLAAQIAATNADLAAQGRAWRLPVPDGAGAVWTTAAGVLIRAQEPDMPSGLSYPQVRLVPGSLSTRQDTSGRGGLADFGVSVACYLDERAVAAANAAASVSGQIDEELLVLAVLDLADAAARVLRDPTSGLYSAAAGVVRISADLARAPQIHQVPAPGSRASAVWCALELRAELETTY